MRSVTIGRKRPELRRISRFSLEGVLTGTGVHPFGIACCYREESPSFSSGVRGILMVCGRISLRFSGSKGLLPFRKAPIRALSCSRGPKVRTVNSAAPSLPPVDGARGNDDCVQSCRCVHCNAVSLLTTVSLLAKRTVPLIDSARGDSSFIRFLAQLSTGCPRNSGVHLVLSGRSTRASRRARQCLGGRLKEFRFMFAPARNS